MNRAVCPYLCALDANNQPQPPIDYPSFENLCRATGADLLLLADQATFCLSGEHRACLHFVELPAAPPRHRVAPSPQPAPAPDLFDDELAELTMPTADLLADPQPDRRRWAWIGAALIFATVLMCGGSWAAYAGWQAVSERALVARPGQIETLPTTAANPAFIIQTATSTAAPPSQATTSLPVSPPVVIQVPAQGQVALPLAVTPTPIVVAIGQAPAAAPVTGTQLISVEAPPNIELPTPVINLQLEVPVRRPTPIFDLPTSTPAPAEPTPTPTPTVVLGTPFVIFAPAKKDLQKGECTFLRWNVENVRAVYYENQGVNGKGEDEECIEDQSLVYTLMVVLGDGSQKTYTTTLNYLPPTVTPTPTPTFTPEITPDTPTPTWTPNVPTDTPTPPVIYGVELKRVSGEERTCALDSDCEFDLYVTNMGTARDNLVINFTATGPWFARICSDEGCAESSLTVAAVEPGHGKDLKVKIRIPADAGAQQAASYTLQAASGSATSATVNIVAKTP